jgi:hypothetical protein
MASESKLPLLKEFKTNKITIEAPTVSIKPIIPIFYRYFKSFSSYSPEVSTATKTQISPQKTFKSLRRMPKLKVNASLDYKHVPFSRKKTLKDVLNSIIFKPTKLTGQKPKNSYSLSPMKSISMYKQESPLVPEPSMRNNAKIYTKNSKIPKKFFKIKSPWLFQEINYLKPSTNPSASHNPI